MFDFMIFKKFSKLQKSTVHGESDIIMSYTNFTTISIVKHIYRVSRINMHLDMLFDSFKCSY